MAENVMISAADHAAIYTAYDRLKQEQGGLSAVSIGKLSRESRLTIDKVQQFLISEARAHRVDLHPTSLIWDALKPEDRDGALRLPHSQEPFITATIRERVVSRAVVKEAAITKEFVEECLDRGTDPAGIIMEIAAGKSATASLLDPISREELVTWLSNEVEALIEDHRYKKDVASLLLGYLRETRSAGASEIEVKIEAQDLPEQMDLPRSQQYTQEFLATIAFEGVELGVCYVYANGEYKEGEWVGSSVEWPEGLQDVIEPPEVMIDEPEQELAEEIEEQRQDVRTVASRERDLSEEVRRGRMVTGDKRPENTELSRPIQFPELPGLGR